MPTTLRFFALSCALPLATLAACNDVETGKNGLVQFTPDDCGQVFCDLDDGIAVGGALTVKLSGTDGHSASGLSLASSSPWVIDIFESDTFGSEPEFTVRGTGAGRADLIVVDRSGRAVDYLPVEVATISDLDFDATASDLRTLDAVGFDHAFALRAGTELSLDVTGHAFGRQLTGEVQYLIEVDAATASALRSQSDAARGHLRLTAPSGDHVVRVTAPGGASELVLLRGE